MKLLIEFLKRFAPMLRSGKMSYSDALTRFRAQYARPAEGMEKAAIMKEVEQAPSNVIDITSRIKDEWWKPRPGKKIEKVTPQEVIPKESPMTKDKFFRVKQGLSTQIKLNTLPQNKQLAKEFINRKNAEFNSLNETGKKEILERLEISIKNEQAGFATPVKPEDMASGGIAGELHLNEGGRVPMIFGGSAGLKAMWKQMLKNISKGKDKPVKRLFPGLTQEEKRMEKAIMGTSEQKAFREIEAEHKIEGIEILINRLKHDKKILERQAKNKAMKDPNLDFLTKHMEESMPEVYGPHLKKYTDIDKDILQLETIKKNLIMKDRKLNAEGGRVDLSKGGLAHVLGV